MNNKFLLFFLFLLPCINIHSQSTRTLVVERNNGTFTTVDVDDIKSFFFSDKEDVKHLYNIGEFSWESKFKMRYVFFPQAPWGMWDMTSQGCAYYDNNLYVFYNRGGLEILDSKTGDEKQIKRLQCDSNLHFGSDVFSNWFEYDYHGETVVTSIPLLCASGYYDVNGVMSGVLDVIDIENDRLVKKYVFPNFTCIGAFDFSGDRGWAISVVDETWTFQPFDLVSGAFNHDERWSIPRFGQEQDAVYKDGYIYVVSGWADAYEAITIVDVSSHQIVTTLVSEIIGESEGIDFDGNGDIIVTDRISEGNVNCYTVRIKYNN